MLKRIFAVIVFVSMLASTYAQKDQVLFSVEGNEVNVSEFEYIYSKTNGKKADFSRASLEEYLDLYKKFKLKVQRAKDMKLDTIPSLQQELAGYRQQLANSYLTDKEVTNRLVKELYDRSQKDIDMSHLMVAINGLPNPSPADTLAAYNKTMELMKKIQGGASFADLAKANSADPSAKTNGGRLGFLTAPLPKGFYHLESAMYGLKNGEMTGPVRTDAGYHIVKVHASRIARGEVEAAHILIRSSGKTDDEVKAKALIDSLYQVLSSDAETFETLAKTYSQDKATASKGGYIGFFGINRYDRSFEDAAFALKNDGDFSKPVKSKVGWHIVRRVTKKSDEKYDLAKRRLENKIKKDTRFDLAKNSMISRIQQDASFTEFRSSLDNFTKSLGEDFLTHKWKAGTQSDKPLFSFAGTETYTVQDFAKFCQKSSRKRIRGAGGKGKTTITVANDLYKDFVMASTLSYEETQLEKKYPEFRFLMREYEEGILLFEATKLLVWDKASQDSVGLQKYFDQHRDNFMWKKRAQTTIFTVKQEGQKELAKIRKFAKKNDAQAVLDKFNTPDNLIVAFTTKTFEEGKDATLDAITWAPKQITDSEINNRNKSSNFTRIDKVLLPAPKTLKEARGYVIADYQDYLEKQWIKELESAYKVKVNNKVFDKLVK